MHIEEHRLRENNTDVILCKVYMTLNEVNFWWGCSFLTADDAIEVAVVEFQ